MLALSTILSVLAIVSFFLSAIIKHNIRVEESDRERARRMRMQFMQSSTGESEPKKTRNIIFERILRLATEAGIDTTLTHLSLAFFGTCIAAFVLGYLLAGATIGIAFCVCAPALLLILLRNQASRRSKTFDRQFSAALLMVAQSMACGMTIETAFASVARYAQDPLKKELMRMTAEVKFASLPLDRALDLLAKRTGSKDVAFLSTATKIQKIGGGSLSQVLETTAHKIETRIRLKGLIDSVTSSARWTSKIIVVIPFLVLGALVFGTPDIGKTFWASPTWPYIVGIIAILDIAGLLIMKRLYLMKVE